MTQLGTIITAVTVYPDRARVTRQGKIALEPGSQRLEIADLPLKLDGASVRASARGTAHARLLGVEVQRHFYTKTPVERVRELEEQLEALTDELWSLEAQDKLLQREREALEALLTQSEQYARGLALGTTTTEAQMALFDSLHHRAERVNTALLDLSVHRRELERRSQQIQNELDLLRSAKGRERYTAVVEVEVSRAGELTLELTYVVASAGWQPLYDVRLLEQGTQSTLEVNYLAQVSQRTGEDWPEVALTLSTARPALTNTLPELTPWYVGPVRAARPPAPRMLRMAAPATPPEMESEMATGAVEEAEMAEEEFEMETAMAAVQAEGLTVTYQVPGTVTVPADGTSRKVTVAHFTLTPELDYVSAPKLEEAAYRHASVTNDSPHTLLPGPVNLFVGDEFTGATELDLTAPQGEFELYLGIADRLQVTRELKKREVDKRLLSARRRLCYGYEIAVENLLPTAAKLILHDQIPLPRHEEIKVKLESAAPKPIEHTDLNLLRWELSLSPGEKQTVRFEFTVEHPRGMSLLGLP